MVLYSLIRVPPPCSVNSSIKVACGALPSKITAASVPFSTVSIHVSTFGILPEVITF